MTEESNRFANLTLPMLLEIKADAAAALAADKAAIAAVNGEITRRYSDHFQTVLDDQDKSHGSVTREFDGAKLRGEIKREVKWDSGTLEKLAGDLAAAGKYDFVRKHFKIEFSIPEKALPVMEAALTEDQLKLVYAARTVKFSDLAVSVVD